MIKGIAKGFTLIEVMIAVLIISIGMLAMASLLATTIKVNQTSESRMHYAAIASSAMAMLEQNAVVDYYSSAAVADVYTQFGFTPTVQFSPDSTKLVSGGNTIKLWFAWSDRFGTHDVVLQTRVVAE